MDYFLVNKTYYIWAHLVFILYSKALISVRPLTSGKLLLLRLTSSVQHAVIN